LLISPRPAVRHYRADHQSQDPGDSELAELGGTAFVGSPADFGKLIADDSEKWGKVIRALNIKAE